MIPLRGTCLHANRKQKNLTVKSFDKNWKKLRHMKAVDCTNIKTFQCKYCQESFPFKIQLNKHVRKIHTKKDEGIGFMNIIRDYVSSTKQTEITESKSDQEMCEPSDKEFHEPSDEELCGGSSDDNFTSMAFTEHTTLNAEKPNSIYLPVNIGISNNNRQSKSEIEYSVHSANVPQGFPK